jgi:phage protein D
MPCQEIMAVCSGTQKRNTQGWFKLFQGPVQKYMARNSNLTMQIEQHKNLGTKYV